MADLPKPLPASEWQHDMWTVNQLRDYAAAERAEERERCANLAVEEAHQYAKGFGDNPVAQPYANNRLLHLGWQIADAIRGTEAASRGETT